MFPHEYVINYKRRPVMTPRYYLRVLRQWCEDDYLAVKAKRLERSVANDERLWNALDSRLQVREECTLARMSFSRRDL